MSRNEYKLFSEGRIGGMTLKNRLVRSATAGDWRRIRNGELHVLLSLYRNLALGGVGLIISGDTPGFSKEMLADKSAGRRTVPDTYFEAFASVADEVHRSAPQEDRPALAPLMCPSPFRKAGSSPSRSTRLP